MTMNYVTATNIAPYPLEVRRERREQHIDEIPEQERYRQREDETSLRLTQSSQRRRLRNGDVIDIAGLGDIGSGFGHGPS